jgi:hypothetical protein
LGLDGRGPAIVGTFDPHPKRFFRPDSDWFRLTQMDQRQELFASLKKNASPEPVFPLIADWRMPMVPPLWSQRLHSTAMWPQWPALTKHQPPLEHAGFHAHLVL